MIFKGGPASASGLSSPLPVAVDSECATLVQCTREIAGVSFAAGLRFRPTDQHTYWLQAVFHGAKAAAEPWLVWDATGAVSVPQRPPVSIVVLAQGHSGWVRANVPLIKGLQCQTTPLVLAFSLTLQKHENTRGWAYFLLPPPLRCCASQRSVARVSGCRGPRVARIPSSVSLSSASDSASLP